MSRTEIYGFNKDGIVGDRFYAEIANAWAGHYAIWNHLFLKYICPSGTRFNVADAESGTKICSLARDPQIEESERICLISTYEFAIVKRENLGRLIKALREFPANDTSLKEQAAVLEGWLNDDESDSLTAIAWNQCSVCGDSWHNYHYDKEKGCSYSYRLYEDNIHVYVFDELEESLKAIRKTSNQRRELLQSLKDLRDTYEDYAEYKRFQVSSGFRVSEYDEEVYPAMIEVYEEVIKDLEEIIAQEEGE